MKDRIIRFLSSENKTSAQFADEIGVQPSGVSHILSGRNNPSLDFVLKMLKRYSYLSPEWLLFGKEPMFRSVAQPTLFDNMYGSTSETDAESKESDLGDLKPDDLSGDITDTTNQRDKETSGSVGKNAPERIIFFYKDRSFEEFRPG